MNDACVRLFLARIPHCSVDKSDLSHDDQAYLARLTNARRRHQFLAGRALIRHAVNRCPGMQFEARELMTSSTGKPRYGNGLAISLSHSQEFVACALAGEGDVGLDLQFSLPRTDTNAIAKHYFHPSEHDWIRAGSRDRFFKLWTLKEAYLKMLGTGLAGGLQSVICRLDEPFIRAFFPGGGLTASLSLYRFGTAFLAVATTAKARDTSIDHTLADVAPLELIAST